MRKSLVLLLPLVALCGGCRTVYRPRFDLSPDGVRPLSRNVDGGPYSVVEVQRISVPELACNITSGKRYPVSETIDGAELMPELHRLFPDVFADSPDAVPILVRQIVRSGTLVDSARVTGFRGVAGLNKNLSRLETSDMSKTGFFQGTGYLNLGISLWTFCLVPVYAGTYESCYEVSIMTGYDRYAAPMRYGASAQPLLVNAIYLPLFPKSAGWVLGSPNPKRAPEGFDPIGETPDADPKAKRTALCAAILKALAGMTSDERESLRRNPVALLRDKERGHARAFRLVRVGADPETRKVRMDIDPNRPAILAQSYDSMTRKGFLRFDVSGCDNAEKALAWARDVYVPLVASGRGMSIDASAPTSSPPGRFSVTGLRQESPGVYRLDFTVRE